jgi:hypothetical protein
MDQLARIDELAARAAQSPDGPVKISLLEEAVRLADEQNDVHKAFGLRNSLMTATVFGGSPEKTLPAFAWSLAQHDRDPSSFPVHDLLWKYKWVTMCLPDFPQISRAQIDQLFDDMERRYRSENVSLRPVWATKVRVALDMGDPFDDYQERFALARRDRYADCAACETHTEVRIAVARRSPPDEVLAVARPLTSGQRACVEVPNGTWGMLLAPLLVKGDLATADDWHRRGVRACQQNPEYLWAIPPHLAYAIARGDLAGATRLFELAAPWAAETRVPDRRFRFFVVGRDFVRALTEGGGPVRLRLPRELEPWRADGSYDGEALAAWFDAQARAIATEFDARNGNDRYQRIADAPPLAAPDA